MEPELAIEYESQGVTQVALTVAVGASIFTLFVWGMVLSQLQWGVGSILIGGMATIVVNAFFIFTGVEQLQKKYLDSMRVVEAKDNSTEDVGSD